ncbi:MAG: Radical domain protein [Clostridiales bacterium]|nr:Radical domain protein [Clostridiales bacterium]
MEVKVIGSHNRVAGIPGSSAQEAFREAKKTLVVGVRKSKEFQTCKPSAHYQLPLSTSCPGKCQYCYLHTTLGKKPYLRIYVNIEEILQMAQKYIDERLPETTVFEGAATSDPLAVEHFTGNLAKAISFFGKNKKSFFRFVTKFTNVDSLLDIEHNNRTRFRFSINTPFIISNYEHGTPPLEERLKAVTKVAQAHFPIGFIIGPIITHPQWEKEYESLFITLQQVVMPHVKNGMALELITHRFTPRAKKNILDIFPNTNLPMNEVDRKVKYGQFGYIKYVYPEEEMNVIHEKFQEFKDKYLSNVKIEYFI